MTSHRTTIAGVLAIVAAACAAAAAFLDGDPTTNVDWSQLGVAVMAGIGLISARDNKVTSEQAGAK